MTSGSDGLSLDVMVANSFCLLQARTLPERVGVEKEWLLFIDVLEFRTKS